MSDDPTPCSNARRPLAPPHATSKRRRGLMTLGARGDTRRRRCTAATGSCLPVTIRAPMTAYVNGDLVQITSEVPGTVIQLTADDTQGVRRGQTLLELDPADAQVAMSNAEARLAGAVREVRTLFATAEQLRAQIRDREIELKRAQDDYRRRSNLLQDGAVSSEELSHTQDSIAQMRASLTEAREQLNATTVQIDGTTVDTHPQVLAAEAAVRDASLALRRTQHLRAGGRGGGAPLGPGRAAGCRGHAADGCRAAGRCLGRRQLQGSPAQRHAGRPARGSSAPMSTAAASCITASSSACPPAAAAPLRCCRRRTPPATGSRSCSACRCASRSTRSELAAHPLRVGLSTTVMVDVRDTSGALIASQVRGEPIPVQAESRATTQQVDARIAQILAANGGAGAVSNAAAARH